MNDKTKDLTKGKDAVEDVVPQATPVTDTPVDDMSTNVATTPDSDSSGNLNTDLDSDNAQYIASIADDENEETETAPTSTNTTPTADDTSASTLSSASANASLSASAGLGQTANTLKTDKPVKKKTEIKLDAASLRTVASVVTKQFLRYAPILFFLLVAIVYGFVVLRINTLSNAQPSQSDIDAQITATPIPRIDPNTAKRLENLEDNSQNVQTLFDEARKNPFD